MRLSAVPIVLSTVLFVVLAVVVPVVYAILVSVSANLPATSQLRLSTPASVAPLRTLVVGVLVLVLPELLLLLVLAVGVCVVGVVTLFEWLRWLPDSAGASTSCCSVLWEGERVRRGTVINTLRATMLKAHHICS